MPKKKIKWFPQGKKKKNSFGSDERRVVPHDKKATMAVVSKQNTKKRGVENNGRIKKGSHAVE